MAAGGEGVADIAIYDEVGAYGVSAANFRDALARLDDPKQINLRINSPGGSVFDGLAIHNMLARHKARVVVTVDGLAASIASLIAMAGNQRLMPENAMMMVHNPSGISIGTSDDMRDVADILDKIRSGTVATYAQRTGLTPEAVIALMDAETWFTAEEAVAQGFADQVLPARKIAAFYDLSKYVHPPTMRAAPTDWSCGAARDLAVDESTEWDEAAARERVLAHAGADLAMARRAFLAWDQANPKLRDSYTLQFADVVGGELRAVAGGMRAAASRLPQIDLPQDVKDTARAVLDQYTSRGDQATMTTGTGGTVTNIGTVMNEGTTGPTGTVASAGTITSEGQSGTVTSAGTVAPDGVALERERCSQITAACALANQPGLAPAFISEGKTLTDVLSELRDKRASGGGRQADNRTEVSARNSGGGGGVEDARASWKKAIERTNSRITDPAARTGLRH